MEKSKGYPNYSLYVQSILDRACYTAINSVPASREPSIESVIKQVISMEPSLDVVEMIIESTNGKTQDSEDVKERIVNPRDDSGELFLQVFVSTIIRLTNMLYRNTSQDIDVSIGRTIYSICEALGEADNTIVTEYSNYDEFGNERPNVSEDGWVSCVLVSISASKNIRTINAYPELSDIEFVVKLRSLVS